MGKWDLSSLDFRVAWWNRALLSRHVLQCMAASREQSWSDNLSRGSYRSRDVRGRRGCLIKKKVITLHTHPSRRPWCASSNCVSVDIFSLI